jgi:hypothetical protein
MNRIKNVTSKYSLTKRAFWTSGLFLDCEEQPKFSWCALGEDFKTGEVTWGTDQPPLVKAGTCVSAVFELGKAPFLEAIDCNSQISYVCEVLSSCILLSEIK